METEKKKLVAGIKGKTPETIHRANKFRIEKIRAIEGMIQLEMKEGAPIKMTVREFKSRMNAITKVTHSAMLIEEMAWVRRISREANQAIEDAMRFIGSSNVPDDLKNELV